MRVLLITNHFHPEPNHLKSMPFVQELRRRGHDVDVLTGFPNYPGGKVYAGYRMRWTQEEEIDGVRVTRVPGYPSHDASAIRRITSYVTIALSMMAHVFRLRRSVDVCHVYLGPLTLMWPARLLRWWTGCRIVADVPDLWPESVTDSGMLPRWLSGMLAAWCRRSYAAADRIVVPSAGYRRAMVQAGVPAERIDVIYQWCDPRVVDGGPLGLAPANMARSFQVLYAGNMGKLQGLDTVLDSAQLLAAAGHDVQFTLIGDGVEAERLRRRAEDERIANVRMLGRMPIEKVSALQRSADALLVHLVPSRLSNVSIPSKVQSYLSSGRPVLVAMEGETAQLVERSGGGVCCAPCDAGAMSEAILKLSGASAAERDDMGRRGRAFFDRELSFERGIGHFERVLLSAVRRGRAPARLAWMWLAVQRAMKRLADVAGAAMGLCLSAPVLVVLAVMIRARLGSPVFFVQERPGRHGRTFRLVKFRTMRDAVGADGQPLSDEARLTRFGQRLRSWSLDELPQLWNVLRGDLSLVGPRPLLVRYLERYTRMQARRHDVRPGITGWAQVNGRNAIGWEQRLALDVWYVDHWNLWLDLKILALTLKRVLLRDGISQEGHATMPEFVGSSDGAQQQD